MVVPRTIQRGSSKCMLSATNSRNSPSTSDKHRSAHGCLSAGGHSPAQPRRLPSLGGALRAARCLRGGSDGRQTHYPATMGPKEFVMTEFLAINTGKPLTTAQAKALISDARAIVFVVDGDVS